MSRLFQWTNTTPLGLINQELDQILEDGLNNLFFDSSGKAAFGGTAITDADLTLDGDGTLSLKETATPTPTTGYAAVYSKSDNKLYFQDGAGAEHEIALV